MQLFNIDRKFLKKYLSAMKNILALIIALALSPHIFAETIKIDPSQEKDMWNSVWTRFFSPKTDVFYDLIVSLNPENSLDFVPTAEQIKKLAPANPNGYGTGMEDGMILGGIMMCAVLDKYEVTKDASLKKYADANTPTAYTACGNITTALFQLPPIKKS